MLADIDEEPLWRGDPPSRVYFPLEHHSTLESLFPLRAVACATEEGSPVRELFESALQGRPRAMFTSIADSLVAKGEAKGMAKGMARAVLGVLEHRCVSIPEPVRERIASAHDEHQLPRWFDRAFTATSAEDVFDDLDG
jgi:hypothetical protein